MSEPRDINYCKRGIEHDFSNEDSEYCSNGCGEKQSVYTIKFLHQENLKLKQACEVMQVALSKILVYEYSDNIQKDIVVESLEKVKELLK
jgi:hypothetical protein